MRIEENKSLKNYNTFGIDCTARTFVSVNSVDELKKVLTQFKDQPKLILGGGSNMLLKNDIDSIVIHVDIKGIEVVKEDDNHIVIHVKAGENWHDFVLFCVENGYGGIENLSLIPGNVGTAPIQNIGAYGVELKDVFESCTTVRVADGAEIVFSKKDCGFGYRNSVFKTEKKGAYIITGITLKLTKKDHLKNTSYGAIEDILHKKGISNPGIKDISDTVIAIRQSKLPDPKELGNSGSFFKNPVIDSDSFKEFRLRFPGAPFYEVSPTEFKIPAGWLIEQAGFKGKRFGAAGVHKNQALVLVNYGKATGDEIWQLAMKIQKSVKEKFGIYIEPEVNII
jgi:UDP-N-acetylmuramate dehydrogenase